MTLESDCGDNNVVTLESELRIWRIPEFLPQVFGLSLVLLVFGKSDKFLPSNLCFKVCCQMFMGKKITKNM